MSEPLERDSRRQSTLARNASWMGLAILISRVLGLVREQLFAWLFGAGLAADAYQAAFRVPNLLRDLFAEGALSSAFVTVFARTRDAEDKRRLAEQVLTALTGVLSLVCLGIFFAAPGFVGALADEFHREPGKFELTVRLTRVFSPFLLLVSSASLAMGVLNSLGSFFVPSLGSAAFNLGNIVIGGGLAWALAARGPAASVTGFAVGTLAGGALQWLVQWPALRARGFRPWAGLRGAFSFARFRAACAAPGLRAILRLMAPSVLAIATVPLLTFISTSFATARGPGNLAWINYAFRLVHFPLGVFGVAVSTAALPKLAALARDGERAQFAATLDHAFALSLVLGLGSAVGLAVFRDPIISLVYEHGHFSRTDTVAVGAALAGYAVGLVAFVGSKIFVQAFYALDRVGLPSLVSLLSIALNVGLNEGLRHAYGDRLGVAAIPLSLSLTSLAVMLALMAALRIQGVVWFSAASGRALAAALVGAMWIVAAGGLGAPQALLALRDARGFAPFALATLGALALLGALFLGSVAALSPAGRELVRRFARRRRSR